MRHLSVRVAVLAAAAATLSWSAFNTVSAQTRSSGELETPGQADAFVDSIGADSKFSYRGSPYVRLFPTISKMLIDSGIRHLRDSAPPTPDYLERMATLGSHGIRHSAGFTVKAKPGHITSILTTFAPYVDFVESQNEYDSQRKNNPNWISELIAAQKTLYTTVHGNPAFNGITVLGPALSHQQLYAALGPLDQYEDAGNLHYSPCDYHPGVNIVGHEGMRRMHRLLRTSTVTKPIWTTEAGYNDMSRVCRVPDDVIAKYDPRTSALRWNLGEPRTYYYQLVDLPSDPTFGNMGLIFADGSPKPQFTALASLIHVLNDPGRPFTPTPLHYAMSGDTQNVDHTLLQKRDGRYELLLWLEVPSWKSLDNHRSGVPIDVQPQTVSISLPTSITSATIYRYASDWNLTSAPLPVKNQSAQVKVTDAISVIELK